MTKFKSLLPSYPNPPHIPNLPGEQCCSPFDYTKKYYHPHCCPGKRRKQESCSDHDYPGHFSSVIQYPVNPDKCNRKLPYEYYHHKVTVHSEWPWKILVNSTTKTVTSVNYKTGCGCGK